MARSWTGAAALAILLASCAAGMRMPTIGRTDLFSLGYGPGETQVDVSSARYGLTGARLDIAMVGGIFHVADGNGGRIIRFSSFGDVLSMIHDPARGAKPFMLTETAAANPVEGPSSRSGNALAARYAAAATFRSLGRIAVDSAQTIYAEDRVPDQERVYDSASGAWCDRVVRRFGPGGAESPRLGQEGPGGTPFPAILGMDVVEGDDLVVVSASESAYMAHRFDAAGSLIQSFRIPRTNLPLPDALAGEKSGEKKGKSRMDVSVDGIVAYGARNAKRLAFACNYYRELYDADSGAVSAVEYSGSWLFVMDMATGSVLRSFETNAGNDAARIPALAGFAGGRFFLIEPVDDWSKGGAVRILSEEGALLKRYALAFPGGMLEVPVMRLSPDGILCMLSERNDGALVSWWRFDGPGGGGTGNRQNAAKGEP